MTKRILVGVAGIPAIVLLVLYGGPLFFIFLITVNILGLWEGNRIFAAKGLKADLSLCIAFSLLIFIAVWMRSLELEIILWMLLVIAAFMVAIFSADDDRRFGRWAGSVLLTVYVSFLLSFLLRLYRDDGGYLPFNGRGLVVFLFVAVWSLDTVAYMVGKIWGRHSFFERISPRKTWEGFFGGILGAVLFSVIAAVVMSISEKAIHLVVIAVLVGIFGQMGDLTESFLKRQAGLKDSSSLLPGHGGILDRFDSMMFAGPAVYAYVFILEVFR